MQAKCSWRWENGIVFASAAPDFHSDQSCQMLKIADDTRTSHNVKSPDYLEKALSCKSKLTC